MYFCIFSSFQIEGRVKIGMAKLRKIHRFKIQQFQKTEFPFLFFISSRILISKRARYSVKISSSVFQSNSKEKLRFGGTCETRSIRFGKFAKFTDYTNSLSFAEFSGAKLTESIKPPQNLFTVLSPWNRKSSLESRNLDRHVLHFLFLPTITLDWTKCFRFCAAILHLSSQFNYKFLFRIYRKWRHSDNATGTCDAMFALIFHFLYNYFVPGNLEFIRHFHYTCI